MGDPKKIRKKYFTPSHPWQSETLKENKELRKEFGLKNRRELLKMQSKLKIYKDIAKKLIANRTKQGERERAQLLAKLSKLGIIGANGTLDDVLGLTIKTIMERRLQSLVFRKGLARSMNQARQFITHQHILVNGRIITFPSALVASEDEPAITFRGNSALSLETHPERSLVQVTKTATAPAAKTEAAKGDDTADTAHPAAPEHAAEEPSTTEEPTNPAGETQ